ncbi:Retrovirus-related Pol polyprotein from transposon TNT 1-94 [Gossypium australe]|uniref:Retrovirus-related Pol polyprotein from transposon TNT 1-94 n=1 Tax=Gossypium australe TaxID=47621 RepID=A0A5B6VYP0_9ROSI|nr:Retrovirus-related Pol polyprotein from transposon TNT 1-94 [Gossypium australe]
MKRFEASRKIIRKDVVRLKWISKTKYNENGSIKKYKARSRIDFNETFSPIARMEIIRIFLALATQLGMKVYSTSSQPF